MTAVQNTGAAPGSSSSTNILELQSLRGLAALIVLIHHALRTLESYGGGGWFVSESVLNAHASVVIFFVLSGYVLALSLRGRGFSPVSVAGFYIRRAFRIYPALWVGLMLGAIYFIVFRPLPAPHATDYMTTRYVDGALSAKHVLLGMLGLDVTLLKPLWTITIELAASVVLPGMAFLAFKDRRLFLGVVVILAVVSLAVGSVAKQVPAYLVHFALGVALAAAPPAVVSRIGRWAGLLALLPLMFFRLLPPHNDALSSLVEGLAAVVVIAAVAQSHARWLAAGPLVKLGDWSYSVYILHLPIALALAHLIELGDWPQGYLFMGPWVVAAGTLVITIPLSALVYRFVELPGIALGKKVVSITLPRQPRP